MLVRIAAGSGAAKAPLARFEWLPNSSFSFCGAFLFLLLLLLNLQIIGCGEDSVSVSAYDDGITYLSSENEWEVSSSSIRNYSSSSVSPYFYSSSSTTSVSEDKSLARLTMLILKLTYYKEYGTHDALENNADPRIYFYIETYSQSRSVAKDTTKLMLSKSNIQTWSGTIADTLYIRAGVDSLVITPKVFDSDLLVNDDISPGYKYYWYQLSNIVGIEQEKRAAGDDSRVDFSFLLSYLYY